MSDYWKKKYEEISNRGLSTASNQKNGYWQSKLTELEESNRKKKEEDSRKSSYWQSRMAALENEKLSKLKMPGVNESLDLLGANKSINSANYIAQKAEAAGFKTEKETLTEKVKEKVKEKGLGSLTDEEKKVLADSTSLVQRAKKSSGIDIDLFQKGAFEDGFDWYDIPAAILGTAADAGLGVVQGIANVGEGLADAAVNYVIAPTADLFGADDYANRLRKATGVNIMNDMVFQPANDFLNEYSVLGRTSDSVAQGVGQLATMWATGGLAQGAGLSTAATSAITLGTTGVSAMGSGSAEAYAAGAEAGEAELYGLIAGGAEVITEMIFGGMGKGVESLGYSHGLTSVDDMLAKKMSEMFTKQIYKNMVEFGVKASAEGLEEVMSGVIQAWGKSKTYMKEKDFQEILADENLMEQFIVGLVTSGIGQGASVYQTTKAGQDFITGYTQDEQAVVDKVFEEYIAKQESEGKKLTAKEKNKYYKQVEDALSRGYISAGKIEEVLGGDSYKAFKSEFDAYRDGSYKAYKDAEKAEESLPGLEAELAELGKQPNTVENSKKYDALQSKIEAIKNAPKSADLRLQMEPESARVLELGRKVRDEVSARVKGTRLAESYNELARRKQAYTADPTKYENEAARQTVQGVLDSGLGNGTNEFADKVDMMANLAAKTGKVYKLLTEEQMKEAGYWQEGEGNVTHGLYNAENGDVILNYESKRNLYWTIGHETGHIIEDAGSNAQLQEALFNHAIAKEGLDAFNARLKVKEADYKGRTDTTPERELANDLLGEYIFTDYEFISNLAKTERNIAQKILDQLKYWFKLATAGSQQQRELEKAMHYFQLALEETGKANAKSGTGNQAEGFTGTYSGHKYTPAQAELLADVSTEGIQNATDLASRQDITFNHIGITDKATQQKWIDAGLATMEQNADGDSFAVVNEAMLMDERERRQKNTTAKGGLKFSVSKNIVDVNGKEYDSVVVLDKEVPKSTLSSPKKLYRYIVENFVGFRFPVLDENGNTEIVELGREKDVTYKNNKKNPVLGELAFTTGDIRKQVVVNTIEVINESVDNPSGYSPNNDHGWLDENGWISRKTYVLASDGKIYEAFLRIARARDGRNILYGVNLDAEKGIAVDESATQKRAAVIAAMPSGGNVAQNKPGVKGKFSYSSIANSFFEDETLSTDEFLDRDYHETEFYKQYTEDCINNMRQTMEGFDESKVGEYRESIRKQLDGIVEVAVAMKQAGYDIRDSMTVDENGEQKAVPLDGIQDSKNRSLFTSLEPNSDYITSHDISTICDKRKNFAEIYDEIVRIEEAKGVPKGERFFDNINNYFAIHKIMADKGLTTPCRQCYVESMRKNLAPMATAFLDLVQETNPDNTANAQLYHQKGKDKGKVKDSNQATREFVLAAMAEHPEYNLSAGDLTIEMLTTEDGLAQLRIQAPLVYEAFNSFYGQAKPKMPKSATPFRFGELTAMLTDSRGKVKKGLIDKINHTGGFRLQSYSDFQIQNFADVLQVLFEAGTLGLNGHAYTKVPAFLDATEGTNLKRNISIFMYKDGTEWKLDRNDSFPYSLDEIYELVKNDKTGNTSIIAVSQNREMSAWIMANDLVGYGIPFHKSGLAMATVRDTIVRTEDGREVKGYTGTIDHTKQQTEVYKSNVYDEEGKLLYKANTKVKKGIDIYGEAVGWDFENKGNLTRNELIKKNLMGYIDACEKAGYRPKFREYVMNNGGVLNDVLRFAKELGFVDENATIDDISFEYKGYRIPYGYYKFLGDFGMFTPDGKAAPQKPLSLEGYDFEKAKEFFSDAESLRRTEILQQFANGTIRDGYRESDMSTEDLENLAARKRTEVANEALGIEEDIAPVAEDIAPVSAKFSVSKADDVGYHAGDLGKAEALSQQGLGRDTGHFGTGTYFVGNRVSLDGYNTRNGKAAPIETVNFAEYNLFKPKNAEEGFALHDFLRGVDGYLDRDADAVNTMEEYESLQEKLRELVYDIEDDTFGETDPNKESWLAVENEFVSIAKRMMGNYKVGTTLTDTLNKLTDGNYQYDHRTGEYYSFDFDTDKFTYYDESDILQMLNAHEGGWKAFEGLVDVSDDYYSYSRASRYENWSNSVGKIANILGVSEQQIGDIIRGVTEDINSMGYTDEQSETADSAATRFMKALGYEGIDVRGIKALDNTSYGSVIYDLKGDALARKQEIGTAKYSMSKVDSDYMNAIYSDDTEVLERMVEEAANTAGFETRMFHETDADNIHIFDISRGTHGGTDYQTPYGIFTKTSPKNIGLGSKQMSLFVKAHNTLQVENREDVVNKIPGFAEYYDQITEIDRKYDALANELEDEEFDALMEWMEEHPDADMDEVFPNSYIIENKPADIDSEVYLAAHKKRIDVMNEWKAKYDEVAIQAKAYITNYLRSNGYDSMYFVIDGGSRGRQTDSLIVLDENQVKSAAPITYDDNGNVIPLSQRFNSEKDDIRYSVSKDENVPGEVRAFNDRWSDFSRTDPLDELAPVREDIPKQTAPVEDIAPVADDWRESFEAITDDDAPPVMETPVEETGTVTDRLQQKIDNTQAELDKNRELKAQSLKYYDEEIARLEAKYESKKNKNSKVAQGILRSIERLKRLQGNIDADYAKRISDLEARVEKMSSPEYRTAEHRKAKMEEHTTKWQDLIGDTSTWKDFALGLSYKTKTLRRILRKVVRGADGRPDIKLADQIYDELETKYDHNEALLKRESARLKEVFGKLKLNSHEDTYAHMLGELRHNPQTTLTKDDVDAYYNKHKKSIDTKKVDTAIDEARKTFDELIVRVNEVLREQGFKEIPYRKGYFPHFTNPKQTWLHKLLNWKPVDNEIPTSIAGLTEQFKPQRSWQTFNKERKGDTTDYSLYQGLDTYIHGALDWIYHIDDLQSRRALENHLRYIHSEEGIKARIDEIKANDTLDADETQKQIEAVLAEAKNPLNGLVTELMRRTNTLANKKASGDRKMEDDTNRKVYSTMTNLNNRINANMVVGSLSSALTNFIPMVQSWHQVSPVFTVKGLGDYIRSVVHDDGMIEQSDFLTNRLVEEEKLYKTGWDKVADKAAWFMNVVDGITSNTVWRSKYLQNMKEGMSQAEAIRDADQFAKNLMAGRSRGNAPSIFDEKNPVTKIFTAFQLEVANQYGYMFEDVPQDSKNAARLVKGYATALVGAYLYNALYSSLVGRNAAFDPISILAELFKDMGWGDDDDDEEKEPEDIALNLVDNILEEVPFIGGLVGGGRIPISSVMPYEGDYQSFISDAFNDEVKVKEMLKPLYYLLLPVGGGQLKKTVEGLGMFDDDLPISGSYTDSGKLRFPVEDTIPNRIQAALFGQYSSKDARYYFDNDIAPLGAEQIQEYQDVDIPIRDYWDYREGLSGLMTAQEKIDYINSLDLPIDKKNILINNQLDRKESVDMTDYGDYGNLEEFDFATKNPEKYEFFESIGVSYQDYKNADDEGKDAYNWAYQYPDKYTVSKAVTSDLLEYRKYTSELNDLRADKDANGKTINGSAKEKKIAYINGLDIDYGAKLILYKDLYPSDNTYNSKIIEYLNGRSDISFQEKLTIMRELGFTVKADGTVSWN